MTDVGRLIRVWCGGKTVVKRVSGQCCTVDGAMMDGRLVRF